MMAREDVTRRYTVSAVERTFRIVEELARERHGLRLTELTERLGLPKSTAFGILVTMERLDYVEHDPETGRYRLGLRLYSISAQHAERLDLVQVALPSLKGLVEKLGETSNLGVLQEGKVLYLASLEGAGPLRVALPPGQRAHVHCTALGKVLLAHRPEEERQLILSRHGMPRQTPRTCTDPAALEEELARIREQGWGLDDEEEAEGVRCIAAPLRGRSGEVLAAVSITGPAQRMPESKWAALSRVLIGAADAVSRRLGYLGN